MKKWRQAFFHTSQHICLISAAYASSITTFCFIYCATFFTYNFERSFFPAPVDRINHPERSTYIHTHQAIIKSLCAISIILCSLLVFTLNKSQIFILLFIALFVLLYSLPKITRHKRLKEFYLAKEFIIIISWVFVMGPCAQGNYQLILPLFAILIPSLIICDLNDTQGDLQNKLPTFSNTHHPIIKKCFQPFFILICFIFIATNLWGFAISTLHLLIAHQQKSTLNADLALFWPALFIYFNI